MVYSKGVHLGNWREEDVLEECTGTRTCALGAAIRKQDSGARVLTCTEQTLPKDYASTSGATFIPPAADKHRPNQLVYCRVPPREAIKAAAARAVVAAEKARAAEAAAAAAAAAARLPPSVAHTSFVAPPVEAMPARRPRGGRHNIRPDPAVAAAIEAAANVVTDEAITVHSATRVKRSHRFTDPFNPEGRVEEAAAPETPTPADSIDALRTRLHAKCGAAAFAARAAAAAPAGGVLTVEGARRLLCAAGAPPTTRELAAVVAAASDGRGGVGCVALAQLMA